jgi:hypothetical protein
LPGKAISEEVEENAEKSWLPERHVCTWNE